MGPFLFSSEKKTSDEKTSKLWPDNNNAAFEKLK